MRPIAQRHWRGLAGGLGITLNSGLALQQNAVLLVGAGMVALIGLTSDWIGAVMERVLKPPGLGSEAPHECAPDRDRSGAHSHPVGS